MQILIIIATNFILVDVDPPSLITIGAYYAGIVAPRAGRVG